MKRALSMPKTQFVIEQPFPIPVWPVSSSSSADDRALAIRSSQEHVVNQFQLALLRRDWSTLSSTLAILVREMRSQPRLIFGLVINGMESLSAALELPVQGSANDSAVEASADLRRRLMRMFRLVIEAERDVVGRADDLIAGKLDGISSTPSPGHLHASLHVDLDSGWAAVAYSADLGDELVGQSVRTTGLLAKQRPAQAAALARTRNFLSQWVHTLLGRGMHAEALAAAEDALFSSKSASHSRRRHGSGKSRSSRREEVEEDGRSAGEDETDSLAKMLGSRSAQGASASSQRVGKHRRSTAEGALQRTAKRPHRALSGCQDNSSSRNDSSKDDGSDDYQDQLLGAVSVLRTVGEDGQQSDDSSSTQAIVPRCTPLWHCHMHAMAGAAALAQIKTASEANIGSGPAIVVGDAVKRQLTASAVTHLTQAVDGVVQRLRNFGLLDASQPSHVVSAPGSVKLCPSPHVILDHALHAQRGAVVGLVLRTPHLSDAGGGLAAALRQSGREVEGQTILKSWKSALHIS